MSKEEFYMYLLNLSELNETLWSAAGLFDDDTWFAEYHYMLFHKLLKLKYEGNLAYDTADNTNRYVTEEQLHQSIRQEFKVYPNPEGLLEVAIWATRCPCFNHVFKGGTQ